MIKIFKYPIFNISHLLVDQGSICHIDVPDEHLLLSVQLQGTMLVMYAAVRDDGVVRDKERYTFFVIGTGYAIPDDVDARTHDYRGSFGAENGLVAHVFEKRKSSIYKEPK